MFDIGGGELLVIGIVALVVIGPKELPGLLRTAGNAMGKVRRMAAEFRGQFDEAMREAELDEAKKAFTSMDETARSATTSGFNPLDTIRNEIKAVKDEIKGPQPAAEAAAPPAAPAAVASAPAAPAAIAPAIPEPAKHSPAIAAPVASVAAMSAAASGPAAEPAPEAAKPRRVRKVVKASDPGTAA